MPEPSQLLVVARTTCWLGWHHHFGPASGSDPKSCDPLGRYCVTVFTGGVNIGQRQAAAHIAGVSALQLSMVRNRHIDLGKLLCAAIAAVVSAFAELDVVQAWGDGTAVAADGMHVETYSDNLAVGADVGIPGLRPHRCRHTCGTRLRQGGADSAQVRARLGHASLDTAARYFRSGSAENAAVIERTFDR
jgi:hypothetical protein